MGKLIVGVNDLATVHPELLNEWDYEKNDKLGIYPDIIAYGSDKKVWWKCNKFPHSYECSVSHKVKGSSCPFCAGQKVLKGFNDLATVSSDLLNEWDYNKNNKIGIYPDNITCGSNKKVWWKCSKGHSWNARISHRSNGIGCPYCSGRYVVIGVNDLATKFPKLLKEWDYEENNKLKIYPDKVKCGSDKKVWWKCSKGHKWQASIYERTINNGCPICSGHEILVGYNDLATTHPLLAIEWNHEKNYDLLPTQVTFGSNRKVWWKCSKCGHEWYAVISSRSKGHGCPECAKKKTRLINSLPKDGQSLKDNFPQLVKEWDYEENNKLKIYPDKVKCGSDKKVWWKCSICGHKWQTSISHRCLRGTGCPKCSSIYKTSFPEQAIYYFLNVVFPGKVKNRYRLKDDSGYIEADVYLPEFNLVIEYDGKYWHKGKQEKDLNKECRFKAMELSFIRIAEHNRNKVIDNCILYNSNQNRDANLTWAIRKLFIKLNISASFVNVLLFKDKILEFCHTNEIKDNFAIVHSALVKEWNYEKNGTLRPEYFMSGSSEKVWWKCSICGHEWQARISHRSSGIGCPVCARKLTGFKNSIPTIGNSLKDKFPELLNEWDFEKNKDINLDVVAYSSNKKVWWRCSVCGYKWQSPINRRTSNKSGCPKCALIRRGKLRSLPSQGESLQDKKPEIAKEWNYEKNNDLLPTQVTCYSNKKVWWKCDKGHEWQAFISSCSKGFGCCPECAKQRRRKKKE